MQTSQTKTNKSDESNTTNIIFNFEKKFPEIGDLVVCNPIRIDANLGIFVTLPEFDTPYEGFISISEISKQRKYGKNPTKFSFLRT